MSEATRTQDLAGVTAFLRRWTLIAASTRDRAAHESALSKADALLRGEHVGTETWATTRSRLGI